MITIEKAHLDLQMKDEAFACELYGKWESLYPSLVERVIDDVLSRYDHNDEVIRLETVTLDLGEIPESEFYRQFPKLLAEKLEEFFADCFKYRGKYPIEVIPIHTDKTEVLLYFLLHGFLPQGSPAEFRNLSALLQEVVGKNGTEFLRLLKGCGNILSLRERLVYQFSDESLEAIVNIAEPSEAVFIRMYVRYLIASHRRLERPEITARDHRNVVWQVVLAYLLYDSRSFFSRKQMVWQTVKNLAAHFNLDFFYLLQLLSTGVKKFTGEWVHLPELLVIFSDLHREALKETPEIETVVDMVTTAETISPQSREMLCELLSRPDTCHRILSALKEKEIIRLVEWIMPEESPFIISYARSLEQEKDRGMLEGKAGEEFRLLKWEFLFLVLLDSPVSVFQRTRFVRAVITRIARHYNLDVVAVMAFLCADTTGLPVPLADILRELFRQETGGDSLDNLGIKTETDRDTAKITRLIDILSHPVTARQFLQGMSEIKIYRLTENIIPSQATFIIAYAQCLDREKERGMLEGKAGTEFRLLKWEFMFSVTLCMLVSAFNRKYFVRTVLQQLSAHYNLSASQLLDYFYRTEIRSGLPENLQQVITELWEEEKIRACVAGKEVGEELYFKEVFGILSGRSEISEKEWDKAGVGFVMGLLQYYRRPDVAEFIRKWKKQIWNILFQSEKHAALLYEKISGTQGLWKYLTAEYKEEALTVAFLEKHLECAAWKECSPVVWKTVLEQGNMKVVFWWLNNTPEAVGQMWWQCSQTEEQQILEGMAGNRELQKLWLDRLGHGTIRQVVGVFRELKNRFSFFPEENLWLQWVIPYTRKQYVNYSGIEILALLWEKLTLFLSDEHREEIIRVVVEQPGRFPGLKIIEIMIQKNKSDRENSRRNDLSSQEFYNKENGESRFHIKNAGLVLLAPFYFQLFKRLDYIEDGFLPEEAQYRAIFLLQYILEEQCEFEETELVFNKILVGLDVKQAIPKSVELTEKEKEMGKSMLQGVMANWDKMKNTSLLGFRSSFLLREGILEDTEGYWLLKVEQRGYDVLLDTLPWSYSLIKLPWMKKFVRVNWRN